MTGAAYRFAVFQEVAYDEDGEDEQDGLEARETQVLWERARVRRVSSVRPTPLGNHTMFLLNPHPTITTRAELKSAVCSVAPKTWLRAKFIYHLLGLVVARMSR